MIVHKNDDRDQCDQYDFLLFSCKRHGIVEIISIERNVSHGCDTGAEPHCSQRFRRPLGTGNCHISLCILAICLVEVNRLSGTGMRSRNELQNPTARTDPGAGWQRFKPFTRSVPQQTLFRPIARCSALQELLGA